jgi:hypothetical protein|uniref:hypothetical protein n=1 Tax=Prosthecobacter sp. TaxID=1965333 RepID=UPI003783517E
MKRLANILIWLVLFVTVAGPIVCMLILGWLVVDLAAEGISSRAIAFDYSTPIEGWEAWKRTQWMNAMPGLVLVEAVIGTLVFVLLVILRRLLRRFPKAG